MRAHRRYRTTADFQDWLDQTTAVRFNRRDAFVASENWAAFYDAILEAVASVEDQTDGKLPSHAKIAVPYWVFEPLIEKILKPFLETAAGTREGRGTRRWIKQYKQDLIDWRRFTFVWYRKIGIRYECDTVTQPEARRLRRLIHKETQKRGRLEIATGIPYPWDLPHAPDDFSVFEAVATELRGTPFEGGASAIAKSYERVTKALKKGESARYYPSKFIRFDGHPCSQESAIPK